MNKLSRRRWLQATGWVAAGITVAGVIGWNYRPVMPTSTDPAADAGAFWLQLTPQGRLKLWCPVHELGQGTPVGLAQIAAEELGLSLDRIDIVLASTDELPRMRMTTGSAGIASHARPIARAAAGLRELLRQRAASALGLPVPSINDAPGGAFAAPDGRRLTVSELLAGKALVVDAASLGAPVLYSFDAERPKRVVGQPAAIWQASEIVRGAPVFAADVRLDGMVHGRAVQQPRPDARMLSADEAAARRVPGVLAVVVDQSRPFVGVVARTPRALQAGLRALRVQWTPGEGVGAASATDRVDIDRALAAGDLQHVIDDTGVRTTRPWTVDVRCDLPPLHHAQQEPRSAVARFSSDQGNDVLELWLASQDSTVCQRRAAAELGWSEDRVRVHRCRVGGAFGGRALYDVAGDAMRLARACGLRVKVQWSREDEFIADRLRPPSSHRLRLQLDERGRVTDWWHAVASGPMLFTEMMVPRWAQGPVNWLAADFGATRSLVPPYELGRRRIEFSAVDLPVHVGPMRSLGAGPNVYAIESAMNEAARVAGQDPLDFRLAHLPADSRLARCLLRLRERMPPSEQGGSADGKGRGVACGTYHDHSHVACAVDVRLDAQRGAVVDRFVCVQDTGLVINPDQVRAQIEGNLMLAISQVLLEHAPLGRDGTVARRLADYPVAGMRNVPSMEIELVDDGREPPAGVGEVALIAAIPALAAALHDATGQAVHRLPWQRDT